MSAQAALFDLSSPPPPAAPLRCARGDREAWARAMATLPPAPPARGLHVCALPACGGPIGKDEGATALAVAGKHNPFDATRVDAENIVFHSPCHEAWWRDRVAMAWAIVNQGESRHGG